jgi:hypothetical protein
MPEIPPRDHVIAIRIVPAEQVRSAGMDDEAIGQRRPIDDELADDELVGELRRLAAELDPVPEEVHALARGAITTRDLDRELAVLIADSAADAFTEDAASAYEQVRTGTAGGRTSRMMSFEGGDFQIDLEITDHGGRLDLIGQVGGASIEEGMLEYASGGSIVLEIDDLGRFLVSGGRRGPMRARLRSTTGAEVVTAWVTI